MHAVVMESLEEYLAGVLEPAALRDIEAHLNTCESCREEVGSMREISQLFGSLRSEESPAPSPAFYAEVVRQVEAAKPAPSFAGFFAFDLAFARRLAFASLLTLAILGGYLVSREADYTAGPSPEAVLAQQDAPAFDSAPGQDNMLVTLTAYER